MRWGAALVGLVVACGGGDSAPARTKAKASRRAKPDPAPPPAPNPSPPEVAEPPAPAPAAPPANPFDAPARSPSVLNSEWHRLDLPYASVEFPKYPTTTSVEAGAGTRYMVEYPNVALLFSEVLAPRTLYGEATLSERLTTTRDGLLRGMAGEIISEKRGRKGPFRTLNVSLKVRAPDDPVLVITARMAAKRDKMTGGALSYVAIASWADGTDGKKIADRFLDSVRLGR